jgi:hypothetical protein
LRIKPQQIPHPSSPSPQKQIRRRQGTPGQTRLLLKRPGTRQKPAKDAGNTGLRPGHLRPGKRRRSHGLDIYFQRNADGLTDAYALERNPVRQAAPHWTELVISCARNEH